MLSVWVGGVLFYLALCYSIFSGLQLLWGSYGKPDYQASEMVIGESERVMGIKDDAWDGAGLEDLKHPP